MIRYRRLDHQFVEDIPETLEPGILYVSLRYATALHLCCCGCKREVVTPLSPAQWRMTFDGESVSLDPSIGSWGLPCRSHYVVSKGRVIEAAQWSDEEVEDGRLKDRAARSAYFETRSAASDARTESSGESDVSRPPTTGRRRRPWRWLSSLSAIWKGRA